MDALKNLEASVQSLMRLITTLREERDEAVENAEEARRELHETRMAMEGLRQEIESLGAAGDRLKKIEQGKAEIVGRLHDVVKQLDRFIDIEITTNEKD